MRVELTAREYAIIAAKVKQCEREFYSEDDEIAAAAAWEENGILFTLAALGFDVEIDSGGNLLDIAQR